MKKLLFALLLAASSLAQAWDQRAPLPPLALPEKTDLDVTLLASVSGTAAGCAYGLILIAN
jgi:hypothetical protein